MSSVDLEKKWEAVSTFMAIEGRLVGTAPTTDATQWRIREDAMPTGTRCRMQLLP